MTSYETSNLFCKYLLIDILEFAISIFIINAGLILQKKLASSVTDAKSKFKLKSFNHYKLLLCKTKSTVYDAIFQL